LTNLRLPDGLGRVPVHSSLHPGRVYKRALAILEKALATGREGDMVGKVRLCRVLRLASILVVLLTTTPVPAQSDRLNELNREVVLLLGAGKYAEAMPVAQRALTLAEWTFGPEHPNVGTTLNNLAELYRVQGHIPMCDCPARAPNNRHTLEAGRQPAAFG
jgi:Tetratricopeptide repeat